MERKVEEAIEIEQEILTGVDNESLQEVAPAAMLKRVKKFLDKQKEGSCEMLMRVIALFITCYSVPDREYSSLLKKVGKQDKYRQALEMVQKLKKNADGGSGSDLARRLP